MRAIARFLLPVLSCLLLGCGGSTTSASGDGGRDADSAARVDGGHHGDSGDGGHHGDGGHAGDGGDSGDGSPPMTQCKLGTDPSAAGVCADQACVTCEQLARCKPFDFSTTWKDTASCVTRYTAGCEKVIQAPHVTTPLSGAEACAKAIPTVSCADFLTGVLPAACATSGDLAAGATCLTGAQCATGFCASSPSGGICGQCATPAVGAKCSTPGDNCGPGLVCGTGVCGKYGQMGDMCLGSYECVPSLACRSGKCAPPATKGQPCTTSDDCDVQHGLGCDTMSSECEPAPVGTSTCGQNSSPVDTVCGPGFYCSINDSPPGSCMAVVADGKSCAVIVATASPPICQPLAVCTSASLCALPDPTMCP